MEKLERKMYILRYSIKKKLWIQKSSSRDDQMSPGNECHVSINFLKETKTRRSNDIDSVIR